MALIIQEINEREAKKKADQEAKMRERYPHVFSPQHQQQQGPN